MRLALIGFAFFWSTAIAEAQDETAVQRAVSSITPEDMLRRIAVMADDSMLGRNTPSPELDLTAEYVSGEFARFRLAPGGDDGTFIQRYPLFEVRSELGVSVAGQPAWRHGADVVQMRGGTTEGPVSGPVAIVTGSGDLPPSPEIRDAIVIYVAQWGPQGTELASSSFRMLRSLLRMGPEAIIFTNDVPEHVWGQISQAYQRPSSVRGQPTSSATPPQLLARLGVVEELVEGHGIELTTDGTASIHVIADLRITVDATRVSHPTSAPNVVGILEGSDSRLRDEYVVVCAHMDHIGVGRQVNGDSIRNGADDNASGTAGLIELAEAFATLHTPPRRSVVFLAVSGEEKGLWGSTYFVERESVPNPQIVAAINLDMIGRNSPDSIQAIGKALSDLGNVLDNVNALHPELTLSTIDPTESGRGFPYTSDHASFANVGVPSLFFFNGTHEDYHRVSDEVERINADKAARVAKLIFHLTLELANNPERPLWRLPEQP